MNYENNVEIKSKYINKIIVMIQKGTISLGALYKFSPHFLQFDDVV